MSAPPVEKDDVPKSTLRAADLLPTSTLGLRSRPLRAMLSALGIAIGIASIVAVLGVTRSSQSHLLARHLKQRESQAAEPLRHQSAQVARVGELGEILGEEGVVAVVSCGPGSDALKQFVGSANAVNITFASIDERHLTRREVATPTVLSEAAGGDEDGEAYRWINRY